MHCFSTTQGQADGCGEAHVRKLFAQLRQRAGRPVLRQRGGALGLVQRHVFAQVLNQVLQLQRPVLEQLLRGGEGPARRHGTWSGREGWWDCHWFAAVKRQRHVWLGVRGQKGLCRGRRVFGLGRAAHLPRELAGGAAGGVAVGPLLRAALAAVQRQRRHLWSARREKASHQATLHSTLIHAAQRHEVRGLPSQDVTARHARACGLPMPIWAREPQRCTPPPHLRLWVRGQDGA
jgi:hypothetical protein